MRRYAAVFFLITFALQSPHLTLAAATHEAPPNSERMRSSNVLSQPTLTQTTHPQPVYRSGILGHPPLREFGLRARVRRSVLAEPASATPQAAFPATGINPWWRYQEEGVGGGDHVMVNVGTGNMVVQSDDVEIAHQGIALAFRRTYNSQSRHDVFGTDGAQPGMYGNGWTNTFDAHIVMKSSTIRSVYDIDGARYDYLLPAGWTFTAGRQASSFTPGNHATLPFAGASGWLWTKKNGTTYYLLLPNTHNECQEIGTVGR